MSFPVISTLSGINILSVSRITSPLSLTVAKVSSPSKASTALDPSATCGEAKTVR